MDEPIVHRARGGEKKPPEKANTKIGLKMRISVKLSKNKHLNEKYV